MAVVGSRRNRRDLPGLHAGADVVFCAHGHQVRLSHHGWFRLPRGQQASHQDRRGRRQTAGARRVARGALPAARRIGEGSKAMKQLTIQEMDVLNKKFENATPEEILRWALTTYRGRVGLSSSFGGQSAAL